MYLGCDGSWGDGLMYLMKCRPCFEVGSKPYLMGPKWRTVWNHGRRKIHKNILFYAIKRLTSMLEQYNKCSTIESRRKRVQFAMLFQLLSDGKPMVEFPSQF